MKGSNNIKKIAPALKAHCLLRKRQKDNLKISKNVGNCYIQTMYKAPLGTLRKDVPNLNKLGDWGVSKKG